jgi:hypothetical protein
VRLEPLCLICFAALVGPACSRAHDKHDASGARSPSATPSALATKPVAMVARVPEHSGPPVEAAPLALKETDVARRKDAVLALLAGGSSADRLMVVETDSDRTLTPQMDEFIEHFGHRMPSVQSSDVKVTGELPLEAAQGVVRGQMNAYSYCYGRGLAAEMSLEGRVQVRLTVEPSGRVTRPSTEGSVLHSPKLRRCLERELANLVFPRPANGAAAVSYVLRFSVD